MLSLSLSLSLFRGAEGGGRISFPGGRKFFKCPHRAGGWAHTGTIFRPRGDGPDDRDHASVNPSPPPPPAPAPIRPRKWK